MIKFTKALMCPFLFLAIASCTQLKSVHFVGTKLPAFEEYKRDVSIWKNDSNVFYVMPINDYEASVATLEWDKDLSQFKQQEYQIIISEIGDHRFLNVRSGGLFTIVRMAGAIDNQLVIFEASETNLKQDIKGGLLKIKQNSNKNVFQLDMSKQELDSYVEANIASLFEHSSVAIITPIVSPTIKDVSVE